MDWQQAVSLGIVAAAAAMLARPKLRRGKFSMVGGAHCACHAAGRVVSASPVIYRARKGERPQVLVKLR